MRRRAFLLATAGVAMTAGCASTGTDGSGSDRHPFAGETVTVRIDERSETEHDLQATARDALAFWAAESETYAGFEVGFEVDETEDPDMLIAYADDAGGCEDVPGFSEQVLGCAPLLQAGTRVPRPVVARVVAGARPVGKVRITTKHEIGHVLGLGHDDDPRRVMSNRPEDRIPLYELRIDIWERTLTGNERTNEAATLYRHAVGSWNAGEYEAAGPAFVAASDAFTDASELFQTARGLSEGFEGDSQVETVDIAGGQSLLSTLGERTGLMGSAAAAMGEASGAAAAGDRSTASERRDAANADITAFRDLDPVEVRDVAVALGLVRGFDRTERVVDVDADPE